MSVDMVIWNGRWSEHRFPLTEYTASNFVSIWAISMLSDDCVSNTFKGGLSPCGMLLLLLLLLLGIYSFH